ncbi:MAG TPA: hypothetical protein VFZ05_04530 [Nitrososphaera sp.]
MSNPLRHIKKKKVRDLNHKIDQVRLRMRNKKAKRDIPRLQAELNALFKQKDEVMRNNLQDTSMRAAQPRLCPRCNERIGRGYHICKA